MTRKLVPGSALAVWLALGTGSAFAQTAPQPSGTPQGGTPQPPATAPSTVPSTNPAPATRPAAPPGTGTGVAPAGTTADGRAAYRVRDLLGSKVSIAAGTAVGTVEDIVLSDEGVVDYLVVSNAGRLTTTPWQAARYNPTARAVTIDIPAERWRSIPTYTTTTYPNYYTPAYRADVYRYYGLTPGLERRLERGLDPRR